MGNHWFNRKNRMASKRIKVKFTSYEKFVIALLAIVQFTVILDFMVLSPLGAIVLEELSITTQQFAMVVSAYAISAGASGLAAAGFADKFDRKKLLLFFYAGFILGTLFCALAPNYEYLLAARIVTGVFGGVMSSISYAIITDLFPIEKRGSVMGFVQTAFAASQVLGIPIGLYLANKFNWHAPFYVIAIFSCLVALVVALKLRPITEHILANKGRNPVAHIRQILTNKNYLIGFSATILLATGGYMLMPFGSEFANENLGISLDELPFLYLVTGIFSFIFGPIIGRLSDRVGKFKIFLFGTLVTIAFVGVYTNLGATPLWLAIVLNVFLFIGISSRIIASSALITSVPEAQDRGAYMSVNSSVQQVSGAIASLLAGAIIYQAIDGKLMNYPILGATVILTMIISILLMRRVDKMIKKRDNQ
jgi:predicted MFS family arabinose efflux permease